MRAEQRSDQQRQSQPRQRQGKVQGVVMERHDAPALQGREPDRLAEPVSAGGQVPRRRHHRDRDPGHPGPDHGHLRVTAHGHREQDEQGQLHDAEVAVPVELHAARPDPDERLVENHPGGGQSHPDNEASGYPRRRHVRPDSAVREPQGGPGDCSQCGRQYGHRKQARRDQRTHRTAAPARLRDQHGAESEHADSAEQSHRGDHRGGRPDLVDRRHPGRCPPVGEAEGRRDGRRTNQGRRGAQHVPELPYPGPADPVEQLRRRHQVPRGARWTSR